MSKKLFSRFLAVLICVVVLYPTASFAQSNANPFNPFDAGDATSPAIPYPGDYPGPPIEASPSPSPSSTPNSRCPSGSTGWYTLYQFSGGNSGANYLSGEYTDKWTTGGRCSGISGTTFVTDSDNGLQIFKNGSPAWCSVDPSQGKMMSWQPVWCGVPPSGSQPYPDADGDSIPDYGDEDIDGDGVPNTSDPSPGGGGGGGGAGGGGTDTDGDGTPDSDDPTPNGEGGPSNGCQSIPKQANPITKFYQVIQTKFPFDFFAGLSPGSLPSACPAFDFFGQQFSACFIRDFIGSVKYVIWLAVLITLIVNF